MYKLILAVLLLFSLLNAKDTKVLSKAKNGELIQAGKVVVKYNRVDEAGSINKSAKTQITAKYGFQAEKKVFRNAENSFLKERINLNNVFVYDVPTTINIQELCDQLNADPSIEYAEPVYISELNEVPNDPLYSQQQHLPQISAPEAWDDQYGNSSVIIGILDTGVDWDHEDLADVIWTNTGEIPDNGIDDDNNGYIDDVRGWDFVDGVSNPRQGEDGDDQDNDPMDFFGHGTHVSGIAAASTNNNTGIASVSSGALIMPLRVGWVATDGRGYVRSDFAAEAYIYAADNGAHITNLSAGSSGQLIVDAAYYAFLNNVLIIYAAGNGNNEIPGILGTKSWVISVASLDANNKKSSFSNFGEYVTVSAPGSNILSTIVYPSNFYSGQKYTLMSGTSMSAPLAASVAGLVKAKHPEYNVLQLFSQVVETADNIDAENPYYIGKLGSGKVNAFRALTETIVPVPKLELGQITISETTGDSDGILEPGETADINIEIVNKFVGSSSSINTTLSVMEDWPVTVINGSDIIPSIGSILDGDNAIQTVTFSVSCSADAFPTIVPMEISLNGIDVNTAFSFKLGIAPQVLFVADFENADDGEFDFSSIYFDDFKSQNISYDYVHRINTPITYDLLSKYNIVVWACEWTFPSLDTDDRAALEQYLDNGGSLFISGQDIGWDLNESAGEFYNVDIEFYNNYLKANYIADDAGKSKVFGIEGDPITDGINSEFYQIRRTAQQQFPDKISPYGGSVPIFNYSDGSVGAVRYSGDFNLVYFGFGGYESILDTTFRSEIMARIINWFSDVQYSLQDVNDTEDTDSPIEVNINITSSLPPASVKLYYDNDESVPFEVIEMTALGNGNYQADIPPQTAGTTISYFIKILTADGWNVLTPTQSFFVGIDSEPPVIEVLSNPLRNSINMYGISPFELSVGLTDNVGIDPSTAKLNYWVEGEPQQEILLANEQKDVFSGTFSFPNRLNLGDKVSYYFSVKDKSINENLTLSDTISYYIDSTQVIDDFELPFLDWDVTGTWGLSTTRYNGAYSLSDNPMGKYENNVNSTALYKMPLNLSTYISGEVTYFIRSYLEVGADSLLFEISNDNGNTWSIVDAVSENLLYFTERVVDISNFTGVGNENIIFRFRMHTNEKNVSDGVFIDDIVINVTPDPTLSVKGIDQVPLTFELSQNYPNPFNPSTIIKFAVPVSSNVNITIYNILGEVVEVLVDERINAGSYSVKFDSQNNLSSGIYIYRINANGEGGRNFIQSKKMLLIK